MRGNFSLALLIALTFAAPPTALAHHSFAMFDRTRQVELKDVTVAVWEWSNPHSWLFVYVPNGASAPDKYSIECANPEQLRRQGFGVGTFKPGDKITIYVFPLKDGTKGASLVAAILPDGKTLGDRNLGPVQ